MANASREEDNTGIYWNLHNKDLSEICYSKCFSIDKKENVFYFELYPKNKGCASLSLWQLRGEELSSFYLLFAIKYTDKFKMFMHLINNRDAKKSQKTVKINGLYDIKTIKTSGLKEILCSALFAEEFNAIVCEADSEEEISDEDSTDEQFKDESEDEEDKKEIDGDENSSKAKQEENEVNAPNRSRGQIALMEKLKEACLNEEDSDIILTVGEQKYPAHKVIIRSLSSVFQAMLKHDMTEKNQSNIDIPDCDPYIFRDFLRYLYTGKLDNITDENVFELYHMSDKYDVKELRMDCVDFIVDNLSVDTICDAIALAMRHLECDMLTHVTKFFMDNAKAIFLTPRWQTFIKEYPTQANELIIKAFNNDSRKNNTPDQQ